MPKSILFCSAALMLTALAPAEPVKVKHLQGEVHAYLAIRSESGKLLGHADSLNVQVGKAWRMRTTMRFLDGSVDDDAATYTQNGPLHLLTDHHTQKGPAFKTPSDVMIDVAKGQVTYHEYKDGKDTAKTEHVDLPNDLCNGLVTTAVQNFPRGAAETKVSYLVSTPKLRVVTFAIRPDGLEKYHVGHLSRSATKYSIHIEIGGILGVIAPIVGKAPPDINVWISTGEAPTFLKLQGSLTMGADPQRLELASPNW